MLKIDFDTFIKDRIWFGWYWSWGGKTWSKTKNPYIKPGIQVRCKDELHMWPGQHRLDCIRCMANLASIAMNRTND